MQDEKTPGAFIVLDFFKIYLCVGSSSSFVLLLLNKSDMILETGKH